MIPHVIRTVLIIIITLSCTSTKTVKKVESTETVRKYELNKYIGPKKKLAITKFDNATRFGKRRLGDNITNVLTTELSKSGRFVLLERERVDQILEQVQLSQAGLTQGTLDQIQLLDADFIITGTVTHYSVTTTGSSNIFTQSKIQRAEVAADVRIINVRTGEIILSETGKGVAERKFGKVLGMGASGGYDESLEMEAFRTAVIKLTENIVAKIDRSPWICDVVKISGSKLYIDAGKKSNIKIGDVMEIYQKGEAIKDLSGRVLGYEETLVSTGKVEEFIGDGGAVMNVGVSESLKLPLICKIKKIKPE